MAGQAIIKPSTWRARIFNQGLLLYMTCFHHSFQSVIYSWLPLFAHVQRMEENKISNKVLYMNLETTRLRGRPRNRWQDEMREHVRLSGGKGWKERVWKKILRTARHRRILHVPMEWMKELQFSRRRHSTNYPYSSTDLSLTLTGLYLWCSDMGRYNSVPIFLPRHASMYNGVAFEKMLYSYLRSLHGVNPAASNSNHTWAKYLPIKNKGEPHVTISNKCIQYIVRNPFNISYIWWPNCNTVKPWYSVTLT